MKWNKSNRECLFAFKQFLAAARLPEAGGPTKTTISWWDGSSSISTTVNSLSQNWSFVGLNGAPAILGCMSCSFDMITGEQLTMENEKAHSLWLQEPKFRRLKLDSWTIWHQSINWNNWLIKKGIEVGWLSNRDLARTSGLPQSDLQAHLHFHVTGTKQNAWRLTMFWPRWTTKTSDNGQ